MDLKLAEALLNYDDHPEYDDYKIVEDDKVLHTCRWYTIYTRVYLNLLDDSYWKLQWARGSTELQDNGPEEIRFIKVMPIQVVATQYIPVES